MIAEYFIAIVNGFTRFAISMLLTWKTCGENLHLPYKTVNIFSTIESGRDISYEF